MAYTVAGTSGLPNEEQVLATGLTPMTPEVAITIGIPVLSAIAATQASELPGIHLALTVEAIVTLASVAHLVGAPSAPRPPSRGSGHLRRGESHG